MNFEHEGEWMTAGLDLAGGGRDYSTLVMVERYGLPTGVKSRNILTGGVSDVCDVHHVIVGIHRWPLGTAPGDVIADAATILDDPRFRYCYLAYDGTGMGAGVSTLVRDLRSVHGRFPGGVRGVTLTGGEQSRSASTLPKVDLVTQLSRALHEGRLHVLPCDLASAWQREMDGFQEKRTIAGNVKYEAQSESVHDDLVMATGLAVTGRTGRHHYRPVDRGFFYVDILGYDQPPPARPRIAAEPA